MLDWNECVDPLKPAGEIFISRMAQVDEALRANFYCQLARHVRNWFGHADPPLTPQERKSALRDPYGRRVTALALIAYLPQVPV